jgi:hypothetical protein
LGDSGLATLVILCTGLVDLAGDLGNGMATAFLLTGILGLWGLETLDSLDSLDSLVGGFGEDAPGKGNGLGKVGGLTVSDIGGFGNGLGGFTSRFGLTATGTIFGSKFLASGNLPVNAGLLVSDVINGRIDILYLI